MEKLLKKVNTIRIITTIITILVGIVTVILAIVALVNKETGSTTNLAIRIMLGVYCLVFAIVLAIFHIAKSPKTFDFKAVALYGPLTGFGIFLFTAAAGAVLDIVVAVMLPAIVAGFGIFLLVKAIVDMINGNGTTTRNVITLVVAILIAALGIVFCALANYTLANVIWIILGVLITAGAIVALVGFIKNRKAINKITDEKKE